MLAAIEQVLPGLRRREWGALAIAAARQAGLEEPDLRELRGHLDDQWAIDDRSVALPVAVAVAARGRRRR